MKSLASLLFFVISYCTTAQNLYIKTYGNEKDRALIFIHGGPSGNATLFESTTAEKLASNGFYVIVYDRRGEGRSIDHNAKFTYDEAFRDLDTLYKKYHLKKAILLSHSFGGLIATLYTKKHPEKISALVLAGALFSQQDTYNHILNTVGKKNATRVNEIKKLSKNTAEYRKACFDLASENGFFKMPTPTFSSKKLYADYEASLFYKNNIRNKNAPLLFYKNEKQNNISTLNSIKKIQSLGIPIYALYGKEDRIFSDDQLQSLKNTIPTNHFIILENCSHYLFVDQQDEFLLNLKKWLN